MDGAGTGGGTIRRRAAWTALRARLLPLTAAALAAGTIGLYWQVGGHGFISLDDLPYIVKNPNVSAGLTWENVRWAFTAEHSGNWHPLTWLSHMLDVQLFGLDAGRHHLVSAVFHAANTVLLFAALSALTGALWPAAFAAALFAWHPLHVESVAWAAERKDVLSTFFLMLTLLAYARYARRPGLRRYALVLVSLALGLMSKPMLVTLPFVLLLLDFWPLGRLHAALPWGFGAARNGARPGAALLEKLPLLALAAASSVVTVHAQLQSHAILEPTYSPLRHRLANAVLSYAAYLARALWPADLAIFYPHPQGSWETWRVALSVSLLAALTLLALSRVRRAPWLLAGWLWYLGTLVPVIGLVQVGDQARADRYTYVPLIGVFVALAMAVAALGSRRRLATAGAVASALFCLAAAASQQISFWKSGLTVYEHAAAAVPGNWLALANVAGELAEAGRQPEASRAMSAAFALNPHLRADTYCKAAGLYLQRGDLPGALEQLRAALRTAPMHRGALRQLRELLGGHPEAYALLAPPRAPVDQRPPAVRYHEIGNELGRLGLYEESINAFRAAIRLQPGLAEAHSGLGSSLGNLGRFEEAERAYAEALRLQPDLADAKGNRDNMRRALRR